jgi:hypothetical protein
MTQARLPERNKRPGVYYAVTRDGIELPIVDVTNPAFAVSLSEAEQRALTGKFLRDSEPLERLPRPLRNLVLRIFLRGSAVSRGVRQSRGTFMTSMNTYLLKLGPDMLGSAYSKPADRRIVAGLVPLGLRLRLQDLSRMMTDVLAPALLSDAHRPLVFVDIAGGPAMDSLNALILLNKEHAGVFSRREVSIHVLDRDQEGPFFGAAALNALSQEAAPLHGVDCTFRHSSYDWSDPRMLQAVLDETHAAKAAAIASSEGGLFEYGSDEDIRSNLSLLRTCPELLAVAGSVTRADEPNRRLHAIGSAATRPRGLPVFRELIRGTGWKISRAIERPFSDHVLLT